MKISKYFTNIFYKFVERTVVMLVYKKLSWGRQFFSRFLRLFYFKIIKQLYETNFLSLCCGDNYLKFIQFFI